MAPARPDVMAVLAALALLAGGAQGAGRVRTRLRPDDALLYRAADRAAGDQVVLVSADEYDAYAAEERYDAPPPPRHQPRGKEAPRAPPVQTIRNYNKVNDDGSFTFGYEAADGSFKEETRGTDCVVRGKYGYVDPDGNKREFTYVSGNPCDPNRPDEEEPGGGSAEIDDDEPANYPAPRAPAARPPAPAPPVAYFQNDFRDEPEERPPPPRQRVVQRPRPTYAPVAITPRPQPATTPRALPPATTFRPQLLASLQQATPQPLYRYSPTPTYAPQLATSPRPAAPAAGPIDFAAEFAKFQQDSGVGSPSTAAAGGERATARPASSPLYSTELVFDPASGAYDTQLFQTLPQTKGELNLNGRLQPYVAQPRPRPFVPSQQLSAAPPPSPLFRHQIEHGGGAQAQRVPQEAYQRQQAETQFQSSAQLFAQQQQLQHSQLQRDRAAARQQAQRLSHAPAPQQYYLVRGGGGAVGPAGAGGDHQASGQIDAFLRTHGVQF